MTRMISRCRICGNKELVPFCDLGEMAFTGIFPRSVDEAVPCGPLKVVRCTGAPEKTCGLVQLLHSFDPGILFSEGYGYRSALNSSMRTHLGEVAVFAEGLVSLKTGDVVVDIGSNDGTLLQHFSGKGFVLAGVDPLAGKYRSDYPDATLLVEDFFARDRVSCLLDGRKAKVILAMAMFYDLEDPVRFLMDIRDLLADDGVVFIEQSYWPDLMRTGAYDTICHEHQGYYGLRQMAWLAQEAGFQIVDVKKSTINGSSFLVALSRRKSGFSADAWQEDEQGVVPDFFERVREHRSCLQAQVHGLRQRGTCVAGYGASTKGNVLLQFCGFTAKDIQYIVDINSDKWGRYCPGSLIPVVDEAKAQSKWPDVFLVLPWHLKDEIVIKEASFLHQGGQFIFPF